MSEVQESVQESVLGSEDNPFKEGDTFYLPKGPGGDYKCHAAGIVDEDVVVYRWYGKKKQWWHYEVEPAYLLRIMLGIKKLKK